MKRFTNVTVGNWQFLTRQGISLLASFRQGPYLHPFAFRLFATRMHGVWSLRGHYELYREGKFPCPEKSHEGGVRALFLHSRFYDDPFDYDPLSSFLIDRPFGRDEYNYP